MTSFCTAVLKIVHQRGQYLPQHKNHTLYFDNWFPTIPLMIKLKALGITALGTNRSNRLQNCPLETDKDFKKSGRDSSSYRYLLFLFLENLKLCNDIAINKIVHF